MNSCTSIFSFILCRPSELSTAGAQSSLPVYFGLSVISESARLHTPLPSVPAKSMELLVARGKTLVLVNPVLTTVQAVPLFIDKRTPRLDEANRFVPPDLFPETASEKIVSFFMPVLRAVQLVLLSVASITPQPPPKDECVAECK